MRHLLTRQQLYDMIWERAVSKVAPELGISDVGLRKQCIAHAVPLPDAVYWGKGHAGKAADRKPLPPLPKNISDTIVIVPRSISAAPAPVQAAIRAARAVTPAKPSLTDRDNFVAATIAAARKAKPDFQWGAVSNAEPEHFRIRAHPSTLERVEKFLLGLSAAATARGWHFAPGKGGLDVVVDGEGVAFAISQTIRRTRGLTTWWDFAPTGEMRLEIRSWPHATGVSRNFADTRRRKLENRIDDILVSFAAHGAACRIDRALRAERHRQDELRRIERARLARLAELEQARVDWLTKKLADQADVEALRRFIDRLGDRTRNTPGFEMMRDWSRERLSAAEARLTAEALAAEVEGMEAFALVDVAELEPVRPEAGNTPTPGFELRGR